MIIYKSDHKQTKDKPMVWTDDVLNELRRLWVMGKSIAEIGREIGVSKNAVVGKAHRIDLPSRPSPIQRVMIGPLPARQVPRPTLPPLPLPPLPSLREPPSAPAPRQAPKAPVVPQPIAWPASRPLAPPHPVPRRPSRCLWPIGEPGTKAFRFCGSPVHVLGKPYCEECSKTAYTKIKPSPEKVFA
jgi:GcrA cell cycle regulator